MFRKGNGVYGWAISYLVIALICAAFGFTGFAPASTEVARILFFVFIALFAVTLALCALRGPPSR